MSGVVMHVMDNPGVTRDALVQKYARYLQPVPLFELIEVRCLSVAGQFSGQSIRLTIWRSYVQLVAIILTHNHASFSHT